MLEEPAPHEDTVYEVCIDMSDPDLQPLDLDYILNNPSGVTLDYPVVEVEIGEGQRSRDRDESSSEASSRHESGDALDTLLDSPPLKRHKKRVDESIIIYLFVF
ncbi:Hypothetical predicted protein [Cloeon dipterum]|uniref:Uncharacterized protein n=1 Tax=Cloeon dipterum TaxID=197152 RepID=A0A8S1E8A5_9INSE|nr:Hypothetical predicted protein [Cloeon dipterum]